MGDEIILNILAIFGLIIIIRLIIFLLAAPFGNLKMKLILFLIGNDSVMANFSILSGHIVPKDHQATFKNNTFNHDVMVSGQNICDVLSDKK